MKMRVGYARRSYKWKTYETPLVITSYRDEQGTPRNKTLANLSKLPAFIVNLIAEALKRGDSTVLEEYTRIKEITHLGSLVIGPAFVVLSVLKQTGIFHLIKTCLSIKHFIAASSAKDNFVVFSNFPADKVRHDGRHLKIWLAKL